MGFKPWHLIALAVVALLLLGGGGAAVVKVARKGRSKAVTNAPAGPDGIVRVPPAELARQAGVPLAVYALARMLRSEHGSEAAHVKTAIGWAAVNQARGQRVTIERLLLRGITRKSGQSVPGPSDGLFGAQNTGKYASTRVDPHDVDIEIARRVLDGSTADPTGGATQFDSPRAQRALLGKKEGYTKGPEEVAAERLKRSDLVTVAGIDPEHLRFWRPRSA